jgi:hypothetical protein
VDVDLHLGGVLADRDVRQASSIRKSEKFFSENQFDFQSWM